VNVDKGSVVCAHRHGHVIALMMNLTGLRTVTYAKDGVGEHIQGFLTNKNRFVDRQEAAINEICFENVSLELGYDKESYIYRILKDNIHGWNSDFDNKDLSIEYKKVSSLPTFHTFLLENYLKD